MRQRNRKIPAKFEVLTVVHDNAQFFGEVTPCRLVKVSCLVSVAEVTQMMVFWMLAMRWAGSEAKCWGREEVRTGFLSGNLGERDHLEDLGIDRTILKCTLKKQDRGRRLD
jgi:hypothetical protein